MSSGLGYLLKLPQLQMKPVRLTVLGVTVGAALIAVLALYFKRRKRRPYRNLSSNDFRQSNQQNTKRITGRVQPLALKSPGDSFYEK